MMPGMPMGGMKAPEKPAASGDHTHVAQGTVNTVDRDAGKINLSHGPVASLNWPAMTMDFQVKDKAAPAKIKQGQRVKVQFTEAPGGRYVITRIAPGK